MTEVDLRGVVNKDQWLELVEAVADGRLSMMEVIKINRPEPGDYFGHVQCSRAFHMLMNDERILKRLAAELAETIKEKSGGKLSQEFNKAAASKDGVRRFMKMGGLHKEMWETSPRLLTGATFEECLEQYLKIMRHLEGLWTDSRDLFRREHYPLATFTAILLLEEMGKIGLLWHELLTYDMPRSTVRELSGIGRDHRQKAFIAVVAGAVVNTRLDRILGLKVVRQVLQDAESGKLEGNSASLPLCRLCRRSRYHSGRTDRTGQGQAVRGAGR